MTKADDRAQAILAALTADDRAALRAWVRLEKERAVHRFWRERNQRVGGRQDRKLNTAEVKLILACLHPDRIADPALKARFTTAFQLFADAYELTRAATPPPPEPPPRHPPPPPMPRPRTQAEWDAARAQVRAENSARAKQGWATRRGQRQP
jgi:hypothetical protein